MVPSVSQGLTYLVNKRSLNVSFIVGVILSTKKKKRRLKKIRGNLPFPGAYVTERKLINIVQIGPA